MTNGEIALAALVFGFLIGMLISNILHTEILHVSESFLGR